MSESGVVVSPSEGEWHLVAPSDVGFTASEFMAIARLVHQLGRDLPGSNRLVRIHGLTPPHPAADPRE